MLYSKPEMEVIIFNEEDVIRTSNGVIIEDIFDIDNGGGGSTTGGSWAPQQP